MVFVVVYLCGMVTLTLSAARTLSTEAGVFIALALVAMGTGGIKANVSRTCARRPLPTVPALCGGVGGWGVAWCGMCGG